MGNGVGLEMTSHQNYVKISFLYSVEDAFTIKKKLVKEGQFLFF